MSTSVYKPLDFTGLSRSVDRRMFCRPGIQKVKRALFGPQDHEATQKFVDEELKKITVNESERWNFDFKNERTLNPNGNFIWQAVPPKQKTQIRQRPASPSILIEELYGRPDDIIRPKAIRPNHSTLEDKNKNKIHIATHQKTITDYMKSRKRQSTSDVKKNSDPEHPPKLPKTTDISL